MGNIIESLKALFSTTSTSHEATSDWLQEVAEKRIQLGLTFSKGKSPANFNNRRKAAEALIQMLDTYPGRWKEAADKAWSAYDSPEHRKTREELAGQRKNGQIDDETYQQRAHAPIHQVIKESGLDEWEVLCLDGYIEAKIIIDIPPPMGNPSL